MKDYGLAKKILGIRIEQRDGYVRLDQESYTRETLEEFGLCTQLQSAKNITITNEHEKR